MADKQELAKKKIVLSPRLLALAELVPLKTRFADVGTDHGYLPLYLLQIGRISSAIASDVNRGPLKTAENTALRYGKELDLRLCDGLSGISTEEVDTVAIAGMGGITVVDILKAWKGIHSWKGRFLIQAMTAKYELRLWLIKNNFTIKQEKTVVEAEKYYTIIEVESGTSVEYSQGAFWLGYQSPEMEDPFRLYMIEEEIRKLDKTLVKISPEQEQRKEEVEARREIFMAMRKEWKEWQSQ